MAKIDNNMMNAAFRGGKVPFKEDQSIDVGNIGQGETIYEDQLNSVIDLQKNTTLTEENKMTTNNLTNNKLKPLALKYGGTYLKKNTYRKAAEGNVAIPMGGMPPLPNNESVSPEMAEEAKSLGIEVAPPGATAEEVADDQLVLLSEGELVVPANVVRYHGLAQYEKMRKAALDGLAAMDQEGQLVSPQDNAPEGLLGPTMPEGAPV
tara:strand:+ start:1216 stop:1836 length:621 start_codon:yes stop_codon:yes gene_type:complete